MLRLNAVNDKYEELDWGNDFVDNFGSCRGDRIRFMPGPFPAEQLTEECTDTGITEIRLMIVAPIANMMHRLFSHILW